MSTQTGVEPATHFRRGWIYVLLLALVTINYMDRSALGVVAQAVRGEFKLSPVQMGYLFSSFLWTYALCVLPVGILLDRFSARNINSIGIALWSLVMAATAAVGSFTGLMATRLLMGAGEATSIPSSGRIVREWMPARERGVANVFWSAGSFVGPAIGAVITASIASAHGWRSAFVVLGALGFVWLICNLVWFDRPEKVKWLTDDERRKILAERSAGAADEIGKPGSAGVVLELLRSPSMWGAMIAQAAGIYALYLLLFWLPSYLQETKHLTIMKTGLYTAVPWAIAVPVSIAIGIDQRSRVGHAHASGRRPARHGHLLRAAGGRDGIRAAYQQYQRDPGSVCVIALGHQCRHFAQRDPGDRSGSPRARCRQGHQLDDPGRQYLRPAGADRHRLCGGRPALV